MLDSEWTQPADFDRSIAAYRKSVVALLAGLLFRQYQMLYGCRPMGIVTAPAALQNMRLMAVHSCKRVFHVATEAISRKPEPASSTQRVATLAFDRGWWMRYKLFEPSDSRSAHENSRLLLATRPGQGDDVIACGSFDFRVKYTGERFLELDRNAIEQQPTRGRAGHDVDYAFTKPRAVDRPHDLAGRLG